MNHRRRSPSSKPFVAGLAADRLRPLWLGTFAALCVATPMLPSETVLFGGSAFVLMLLWWLLLAAWSLSGVARGRLEINLGPATWALFALLAWHSTSALLMAWHGNPRASLNMMWEWLSLGTAFFLARQLITHAAERRAVVAVLISLAVSFSALGFYQYYREFPTTRAVYEKDPEKVLGQAGIEAPPGTPQRKMFEDRLYSTEPLATFALTNSLAGFLAPWLIVFLGILLMHWKMQEVRWSRIAGFAALLLLLGCLVLTKSRSAWLATLGGCVLLALYGRRAGWRPDWKIVAGVGAAAVVLPFLAAIVGGLDSFVLLESSKSFLYRVQYWRATAQLITDYPWFGCGPGNFQQYYTAYKLPEASETIAEPHNFLLEIWATAGTPAVVFALAVFGGVIWQIWSAERAVATNPNPSSNPQAAELQEMTGSVRAVYWGTLIGVLFAYIVCGLFEGYFPSPAFIVIGLPLAMAALVSQHEWVIGGQLSSAILGTAIVVMLINFLAAGGIGFANVAQSLWVLTALLLNEAESLRPMPPASWRPILGRRTAIATTAVILLLFVGFHQTTYNPVRLAQEQIAEAHAQRAVGQSVPALAAYEQAAASDPYSPEPWERACELSNEIWLQSREKSFAEKFRVAAKELLLRNSRSSHANTSVGHDWLAAYRRFGERDYLEQAIKHYGIAIKLYPNYNLGHAQFAWALHLAGDEDAAALEAEEAWKLDELNPHSEQKLARQRIFDATPQDLNQPPPPLHQTAEQVVRSLRKS